jgi:hypothetical protein
MLFIKVDVCINKIIKFTVGGAEDCTFVTIKCRTSIL